MGTNDEEVLTVKVICFPYSNNSDAQKQTLIDSLSETLCERLHLQVSHRLLNCSIPDGSGINLYLCKIIAFHDRQLGSTLKRQLQSVAPLTELGRLEAEHR